MWYPLYMNICSPGILHSVNLFCFCIMLNWLVEGLYQLFFISAWNVHIVKLNPESTANDPKDAISVVHVNQMLAAVS